MYGILDSVSSGPIDARTSYNSTMVSANFVLWSKHFIFMSELKILVICCFNVEVNQSLPPSSLSLSLSLAGVLCSSDGAKTRPKGAMTLLHSLNFLRNHLILGKHRAWFTWLGLLYIYHHAPPLLCLLFFLIDHSSFMICMCFRTDVFSVLYLIRLLVQCLTLALL